ncbi:MAG TPA: methylamine utilization protein [Chthoniobacterales bacterium]
MKHSSLIVFVFPFVLSPLMKGGTVTVSVHDLKGAPVSNAVVYAQASNTGPAHSRSEAVIDQRNKQFVPYVTAVQVGTSIIFPNKDNIRHHVYSLSPAKRFELPLYSGIPARPVLFDKTGFVTLGCNIHDWMIAYVAVLPTPFFQVTGEDGRVMLKELSAGRHVIKVWHPLLKGSPEQFAQPVDLTGNSTSEIVFALDLKPDFRVRRAPGLSTGGYP